MQNEEMEKAKKKNGLIILILGIVTVLIALIGATFAYFSAVITKTNGDQSVTISTLQIDGLIYTAGNIINLENAVPGAHDSTTFKIENPNASVNMTYSLRLVVLKNEFTNEDGDGQLLIKISGGALSDTKTLDLTDGSVFANATEVETIPDSNYLEIVSNASILADSTDNYTLSVEFVNFPDSAQNTNQGKSFAAYIEVHEAIAIIEAAP